MRAVDNIIIGQRFQKICDGNFKQVLRKVN